MLDRDNIPVRDQFLMLRESEHSVGVDQNKFEAVIEFFERNQIPWRFNLVFGGFIVEEQVANQLSEIFQAEDQSQSVRDFLARPEAVRIIGGNAHSMVFYESGSDLMYRVDSLKDGAEPLPDNRMVLHMDEIYDALPIPAEFDSKEQAMKVYKEYAMPEKEKWLRKQEAILKAEKRNS